MDSQDENATTPYLTTKEVADLLRVKERKIYDLAGAGEFRTGGSPAGCCFRRQK